MTTTDPTVRLQAALDNLREMRKAATPGPWRVERGPGGWFDVLPEPETPRPVASVPIKADAALIVLACSPAMLDAIETILTVTLDDPPGWFDTTPGTLLADSILGPE
jgi:hypothetical protein